MAVLISIPAGSPPVTSVTATVASSVNNYSPTGYSAGVTSRLILTPASGGSTITGLVAGPDGFELTIVNASTTDAITFPHLSASSNAGSLFSCPQGVAATLAPLTNLVLQYCLTQWIFT